MIRSEISLCTVYLDVMHPDVYADLDLKKSMPLPEKTNDSNSKGGKVNVNLFERIFI